MNTPFSDCLFRWHAIFETPDPALNEFATSVCDFVEEINMIEEAFHIVPLRHLTESNSVHPRDGKPLAALTFDDALDSQARFALPVLEARRLPYTLCIPTGPVTDRRPLWNTLLRLCILRAPARSLDLGWTSFALAPGVDRLAVAQEVQDLLLCMSEPQWSHVIEKLFCQFADVIDEYSSGSNIRSMTWEQIAALDPTLFEPASHSVPHRPFVEADSAEAQLRDAVSSRTTIERHLSRPCLVFSFPFGIFTAASCESVRRAGYEILLTSCTVPAGAMGNNLYGRFDGKAVRMLRATKRPH